ncbi:MAG: FAD-dependent monooxygenase [Chitinophagaceae bacterium]
MNDETLYDVAITGGGLAGLALAIQLKRSGHSVILFEKEQYPFHRVCGEYISRESWDFLISLGIRLPAMALPLISKLELSTVNGKVVRQQLPLGGFGISRYQLDHLLAKKAVEAGVVLMENTRTTDISREDNLYTTTTSNGNYHSRIACGSFGKRSNLDISWNRPFVSNLKSSLNNYIGVKYHVTGDFPKDTVFLHLFNKGYVGLVQIENREFNLCYLSSAENLKKAGNSIPQMEKEVLSANPRIRDLFGRISKTDERPVTISQISFESKEQVKNDVLLLGDAAGMITPLCGNGMSMALHSSKIAARLIIAELDGTSKVGGLNLRYTNEWQSAFNNRMKMGRVIQRLLSVPWTAGLLVGAGRIAPPLLQGLIRRTHGQPF